MPQEEMQTYTSQNASEYAPSASAPPAAAPSESSGAAGGPSSAPSLSSMQDAVEENMPQLPEMFSLRKPRNALAGVSSGAKSFIKGTLSGLVGLVAAPIVGLSNDGFPGLCAGLANGVVGAIALPVTGAAVGIFQASRGLINTGEWVVESAAGKDWDQEKREWFEYDLQQEAQKMLAVDEFAQNPGSPGGAHSGGGGSDGAPRAKPADTKYYDLLGVQSDVSTEAIKKAYYKRALKLHPDKNPDNPTAAEQFQKCSEAYQVLADPQTRARYDKHGSASLDVNFMDAGVFFTMLFGSERFEPYIGRLALASAASMEGSLNMSRMAVRQQKREVDLALKLVDMVQVGHLPCLTISPHISPRLPTPVVFSSLTSRHARVDPFCSSTSTARRSYTRRSSLQRPRSSLACPSARACCMWSPSSMSCARRSSSGTRPRSWGRRATWPR